MRDTISTKELHDEYEVYLRMWADARSVEGPLSPIALFAQTLAEQVFEELQGLRQQAVRLTAA